MDNEKWLIVGVIVVAVVVIEWLRAQAFQSGRLAGIREAVTDVYCLPCPEPAEAASNGRP